MTGKTTEATTLAAIEAGRGVRIWAAEAHLGQTVQTALQKCYSVTLCPVMPTAETVGEEAVLLLAPSPAEALCQALQGGAEPATGLAEVQKETAALLALLRHHRRRAVLLDQSIARLYPKALIKFCGMEPERAVEDSLRTAAGEAPDAVMMVLAQARLQADPKVARLVGEFAAAAKRLPGVARDATDPDMALTAFAQDQGRQEELDLLRDQQRSMYEQLEALYGEKQQLEQRLEQTRGGLSSFEAQVETLEQDLAMYRGRLRERAEALDAAGQEIEKLEYANARQDKNVQDLAAQLHRLQTSRSYRLMAPLRGLSRKLRGG